MNDTINDTVNDTVLLLHDVSVPSAAFESITSALGDAGFEVCLAPVQSQPREVFDSLHAHSRLAAVLINPEVSEPLRMARYAHRQAPHIPVIFLSGEIVAQPFDHQGAPMPMLRENWTVVEASPERLIPILRNSVQAMAQVRRFRTTLDRFNVQLANRDPIDSPNFRTLVNSQQYLAEILEQSKDAIVSMDLAGIVLSWNQAATQMFGVSASAAIGQPIEAMARGAWQPQLASMVQEFQSSRPLDAAEISCTRNDGTELNVELVMSLVRDWHQLPIGISATIRDIRERKQAERAQQRLVAELEAKNASLEQFNSTVAHDLKSPLITIRGFLRLLKTEITSMKIASRDLLPVQRRIDRITQAADHLGQLLDELLLLSRIDRPIPSVDPVSLTDIAHKAVSLLALQISAGDVEVVVGDLPAMTVEPLRILEVFQNLIENAVRSLHDQPHPRVEIGVRQTGLEPVLYVSDNGIGIDPQYHDKVFEPFEQLSPDKGGTGIGLAIVKRVIDSYNGRVWIESNGSGNGATFCFTIEDVAE